MAKGIKCAFWYLMFWLTYVSIWIFINYIVSTNTKLQLFLFTANNFVLLLVIIALSLINLLISFAILTLFCSNLKDKWKNKIILMKEIIFNLFKDIKIKIILLFSFIIIVFIFERLLKLLWIPFSVGLLNSFLALNDIYSIIFFVLFLGIMGIVEEIIFRGYMLHKLIEYINKKKIKNISIRNILYFLASALVSLIFMSFHILQGYKWWTLLAVFFAGLLLWLIYIYLLIKKNKVVALSTVIFIHMFNNIINGILFIESNEKVKEKPKYNFLVEYMLKVYSNNMTRENVDKYIKFLKENEKKNKIKN